MLQNNGNRHVDKHHKSIETGLCLVVGDMGECGVPSTVGFYLHCGFTYSHRIENFFTDHYDHPIIEDGIRLKDMVYLKHATKGDMIIRTEIGYWLLPEYQHRGIMTESMRVRNAPGNCWLRANMRTLTCTVS